MTLGGRDDDSGGVRVQWPLIAVILTVLVSVVTGAIKLGSVQTTVEINTARLAAIETREREGSRLDSDVRDRVTRIDATMIGGQKRLEAMDNRTQRGFEDVLERMQRIEARLNAVEIGLRDASKSYDNNGADRSKGR